MMSEPNQTNLFNNKGILDFILKYKVHLLVVIFLSFVVSIFACLSITPKFKSTIILFATSSSSVSQSLVTESQQRKDVLKFGEEEDVEQLMQVLLSNDIRNGIVEKFNLFEHYGIDPNSKYPYTKMSNKYKSNIKISRTEYMSVKIDVYDTSPDTAALIANEIIILVDSAFAKIQKERAQKAFDIVKREFEEQKSKIKEIEDSLNALSRLGVIDARSQTEKYSEQLAIAIAERNTNAVSELEKKLEILAQYGSTHTILKEQMYEEVKRLATLEAKYREAKVDLEHNLPNTYVVSAAEVSERKATPVYWVIIFVSVASSFLIALILLIIFEKVFNRKNKTI
ncbi:MAG: hypothetical protein LBQ22_12490 [Bacteroidales bacterium]|jgi:uncharacterized protein involved in exopolysaccharide biosynthesis|nr:hypothetical protein [Bacteroidales bacterium]